MSSHPRNTRHFYLNLATEPSRDAGMQIQALARGLLEASPAGLIDVIPGYINLLVEYDSFVTSEATLRAILSSMEAGASPQSRHVEIPVRYDGPDLESAAGALNMTPDELVRRHSGVDYLAHAIGFTPGFPYMGALEPEPRLPRRDQPRAAVPANSVAIADMQTGIYPLESPGGWHLLGTSLVPVYRPGAESPFLLEPGDTVRFVPGNGPNPPAPSVVELLPEQPASPLFQVQKAGLLDLIVDAGRIRVGRYGLARSGPMDPYSAQIANRLLGNESFAPVLEISLVGPTLEVLQDAVIAFTGWGVHLQSGSRQLESFASHQVRTGDVLRFPPQATGARAYLAVAGGFELGTYLGSASPDVRGLIGRALQPGDVLGSAGSHAALAGRTFRSVMDPAQIRRIRLLKGPQFSEEAVAALTEGEFTVAAGNRMGIQFDGPPVPGGQVISEGNPAGAVQVTPGGRPIILMNDRGTIGGYAKPAIVHPDDLSLLAQLRQGQVVRFAEMEK